MELQGSLGGTHHLTLLDGEMVIDKLPSGEFKRRYLVYDLIMLNQKPLAKVPLGSVISTKLIERIYLHWMENIVQLEIFC